MKTTPYAAFGNVVYLCDSEQDTISQNTRDQPPIADWRYIIKGNVSSMTEDGVVTQFATKTAVISSTQAPNRVITIAPDTQWVCIHKDFSTDKIPVVTELPSGQPFPISKGGNVFLLSGSVSFDDKTIDGPYQLRVRTKDIVLTATADCLLLTF